MYEIHLALIVATVAAVIALRRQPRLVYGLDLHQLSAHYVYAHKLILTPVDKKPKQPRVEFSVE